MCTVAVHRRRATARKSRDLGAGAHRLRFEPESGALESSDDRLDLAWVRETTDPELRKHQVAVDAPDQARLDAELPLQLGRQPGGPRLIISLAAVLDRDVHVTLSASLTFRGYSNLVRSFHTVGHISSRLPSTVIATTSPNVPSTNDTSHVGDDHDAIFSGGPAEINRACGTAGSAGVTILRTGLNAAALRSVDCSETRDVEGEAAHTTRGPAG
jgi:hypothetical protein